MKSSIYAAILSVLFFVGSYTDAFAQNDATIAGIWMAQTHVWRLDGDGDGKIPLGNYDIKFVEGRDALLKVDITSATNSPSPTVEARVTGAGGAYETLLVGPQNLPANVPEHRFEDSFATIIPGQFLMERPAQDLTITILLDGVPRKTVGPIKVGAPTVLPVTFYDIHWFNSGPAADLTKAIAEFQAKLPVKDLEVERVRRVNLDVLPADPGLGQDIIEIRSQADYTAQTGGVHGTEGLITQNILDAFQRANGQQYVRVQAAALAGHTDNQGRGSSTNGFRHTSKVHGFEDDGGMMWHEMGHALSLLHCGTPDGPERMGTTWAWVPPLFHAPGASVGGTSLGTFVSPTMADGGSRRTAMCGGGLKDLLPDFVINTHSGYEIRRVQEFLESRLVIWNPESGGDNKYHTWNDADKAYSNPTNRAMGIPRMTSNKTCIEALPNDPDREQVYSILTYVSRVTDTAGHVYEPVGPYRGQTIFVPDPANEIDRLIATNPNISNQIDDGAVYPENSAYCSDGGHCDWSIKVTQGGADKWYMLRHNQWGNKDVDDRQRIEFDAINVPASDGPVERVELYRTEDANINGLPDPLPAPLHAWRDRGESPDVYSDQPCSSLGWPNHSQTHRYKSCAGNPGGEECSGALTFTEARNYCESAGARLCTVAEMHIGLADGSVCTTAEDLHWTGIPCTTDTTQEMGYWVELGGAADSRGELGGRCAPLNALHEVICCADNNTHCDDGVRNNDEEGVDCGGGCPNACPKITGDIDGNGVVDLADAIAGLKALSGTRPSDVRADYQASGVDVNQNGRVGLEEVLYVLQVYGVR